MNIYPNSDSNLFCSWILIQPYINLSAPQIVLVDEIQTAYAGSTFVSENTWNNFMMVTAKWYQYYLAYVAQTGQIASDLYNWATGIFYISAGKIVTLAENYQQIITNELFNDGTIILNGELIQI